VAGSAGVEGNGEREIDILRIPGRPHSSPTIVGVFADKRTKREDAEMDCEESDQRIVPVKLQKCMWREGADDRQTCSGKHISTTGGAVRMSNELDRIAELAMKHTRVQTVMHHVNADTLKAEHERQKTGKAVGVDRVTKEGYGEELEDNIAKLIARMKTFSYRPQPVKRVYIPKEGSDKLRPLGIPSYEDKLVQGAMRNVLDAVYEGRFYDFSYGFRAGKSQHQAIKEVNRVIMSKKINWVVDADIKGFFDNLDHEWLMKFLEHDIQDKNFLRYIKRFLKAGIMEGLERYESDRGSPQGGLISPVCANVYLHYVLDMWFDRVVKTRSKGDAFIVRYADDFVCMFQYENEAKKFFADLKGRLAKFGLEIAEDKSRVIRFGRFTRQDGADGKAETFDFLGFTHINGKTRAGKYTVTHRISKKKMKVKRNRIKEWIKFNIQDKIPVIIANLNRKLRGLYQYYGISGNIKSLQKIEQFTMQALRHGLKRRSQRSRMTWERFNKIMAQFPLLQPRIYVNIWS
jgi:group II intron reverse transcriptase/maturase